MSDAILYLDPTSRLNLQSQIRQKLVDAISTGVFPAGSRLPSSRKLAIQLRVARNTVVLAYRQLVDEGILVSRERSGFYVADDSTKTCLAVPRAESEPHKDHLDWQKFIQRETASSQRFKHPSNWQTYPYPFLDGQFEASLYPIQAWREATRLSLGVRDVNQWSTHNDEVDDCMLIDEIRTKILPRRGIQARAEEILITVGAQQALYLLIQILADESSTFAIEDPCNPDLRAMLSANNAPIINQPVDAGGLVVDRNLESVRCVCVTPSHQVPTAVTMPQNRRLELLDMAHKHDFLIIEDDFESESNYLGSNHPALRSIESPRYSRRPCYVERILR